MPKPRRTPIPDNVARLHVPPFDQETLAKVRTYNELALRVGLPPLRQDQLARLAAMPVIPDKRRRTR